VLSKSRFFSGTKGLFLNVGLISVLWLRILHVSVTKRLIICHLVGLVVMMIYKSSGVFKYCLWLVGLKELNWRRGALLE
jgi:hypothetical protein